MHAVRACRFGIVLVPFLESIVYLLIAIFLAGCPTHRALCDEWDSAAYGPARTVGKLPISPPTLAGFITNDV